MSECARARRRRKKLKNKVQELLKLLEDTKHLGELSDFSIGFLTGYVFKSDSVTASGLCEMIMILSILDMTEKEKKKT